MYSSGDLAYIWTSGRLCNFRGCDRPDLQPISVAGWFWSGSGVRIAPTNSTPPFWGFQPWSHTGHKSQISEPHSNAPLPTTTAYPHTGPK